MDNASRHKGKTTNRHNRQPMYLPPCSPDLNPIERIWLTMKGANLADDESTLIQ
jgi:transposase